MLKQKVVLHPKAKDILAKHHVLINANLRNSALAIIGIDYFSLNIVDINGIMTTFSSALAYESNLLHSNLWGLDGMLDSTNYINDMFIFWDELYPKHLKTKLIREKEKRENFLFGFYIMKQVDNLFVIYSFATRSNHDKESYRNSKNILSEIGDYFLSELKEVYQLNIVPSSLFPTKERKLQLIVNNINSR